MSSPRPYRGLRVDNGEWVHGWYVEIDGQPYIYESLEGFSAYTLNSTRRTFVFADNFIEVIPETVGQPTGLKDKTGVEMYEGDGVRGRCTVQKHRMYNPFVGIVKWNEQYSQFYIAGKDRDGDLIAPPFDIVVLAELEVIGNIHQNPELLEDKQ